MQRIKELDPYKRAKIIDNFVNNETRKLEIVVDNEIKALLRQKGINIPYGDKNGYIKALDTLKRDFHKNIDIVDVYNGKNYDNAYCVGVSKNGMTCICEDNNVLSCGIQILEIDII